MTIRKLTSLFLVLALLCAAITASAATLQIGNTGLSLNLPSDLVYEELTSEDLADDMIAYYYNDSIDLAIYQYDAEGSTLADVLAEFAADSDVSQSGNTTINGIDTVYCVGTVTEDSESYLYIDYVLINGDDCVEIVFYMLDASASQTAADIMNTLSR